MRRWLAWYLRAAAERLDPPPPDRHELLDLRVRELIDEQDARWPDRDGEGKRHQVYARLIKDFPDARKRDLSLAIESVIQEHL